MVEHVEDSAHAQALKRLCGHLANPRQLIDRCIERDGRGGFSRRLGFGGLGLLTGFCHGVSGRWSWAEQSPQPFQRDPNPRTAGGLVEDTVAGQQLQSLLHWRVLQCTIGIFTPACQVTLQAIRCRTIVEIAALLFRQQLA
jgi:hypothetical protein